VARLLNLLQFLSALAFWPAAALVAWGELTPSPPHEAELLWDKAEHFIAYFGLALMATLFWGIRRSLALVFLAVVALGGILEILQAYVGRDAEWADMLADTLGAMAGLGLGVLLLRRLGPLVTPKAPD
jgi:VanZ family protein